VRTLSSRLTVLLLSLFVLTPASFAQFSQRGSISGVVTETSGAIVPQASVTLLDLGRNQTSTGTTDASGHYEFPQLLPGSYQVSVDHSGFKKSLSSPLVVSPQSEVRCDVQLQLASVSQQVTVTGSSAPLLQTESADLDQNISQQQIANVPMNGRNWTSLTELTPGVSISPRITSIPVRADHTKSERRIARAEPTIPRAATPRAPAITDIFHTPSALSRSISTPTLLSCLRPTFKALPPRV
jgi:hypothetical protein